MIIRQLTLRQMLGTRTTEPLQASAIAAYSEAEIMILLAGEDPQPEGVRFHFDRPSGVNTVGLIAVSLIVVPVSPTEVRTSEFTSDIQKYVRRGATNEELEQDAFHRNFSSLASKGESGNNSVCVFFSRNDLRAILDQPNITHIAFFPGSVERNFSGTPESFDTLLAVGQTAAGITEGIQIRSELPCPPHCPDDYP